MYVCTATTMHTNLVSMLMWIYYKDNNKLSYSSSWVTLTWDVNIITGVKWKERENDNNIMA